MDSIIRKNASGDSLIHDQDFQKLSNTTRNWYNFDKLYFFFASELKIVPTNDPVVYAQLKKDSIRHLIPYKGHYYDYIVRKEYNTLQDWADDNGEDVNTILYGVNHVHKNRYTDDSVSEYIKLEDLLKFLDPNYTREPVLVISEKKTLLAQFDSLVQQMNGLREKIEKMN